jgi:AraC family transcriptional regulator, regulatory protein of adaptative response / methylated-DNA-[protein]-cysteine methyltransferase
MTIQYALGRCSLGTHLVATTANGICAVELGDTAPEVIAHLRRRFPDATVEQRHADEIMAAVAELLDGRSTSLAHPLDRHGTDYQRSVWDRLCGIPAGTTMTYLELARAMGDPGSLRAVAGACAANPLAVIIPCHRVLRTDGGLGGYRWGLARKRALLVREGALDALSLFDVG